MSVPAQRARVARISDHRRLPASHRAEAFSRALSAAREMLDALEEAVVLYQSPALERGTGPELSVDQALAFFPGRSRHWLLKNTRGMPFRKDYSRRTKTFESRGFHRWREGMTRGAR